MLLYIPLLATALPRFADRPVRALTSTASTGLVGTVLGLLVGDGLKDAADPITPE